MNLPLVDENLYVWLLRNRDIPYDIGLGTFNNQNSKTKKFNISPRHRSLTTNHKLATVDLLAQIPNDRNEFLTLDKTFRQKSPPMPLIEPEQIYWTYDQVYIDRASEKSSLMLGQDHGGT